MAQLNLCDSLGNGTLRITNRQDFQLHGVLKKNVRQAIRRINEVQLTTLGACGDVERNVLCCPAPYRSDPVHAQMQEMARRISAHLLPRTPAYHEIWLTDPQSGQPQLCGGGPNGQQVEPIYGNAYLPRKFKTAIALPGDNCVDVYANDLGFLAICENYRVVGYNVLVGGGFGVTPSDKKTFPALAKQLCFRHAGRGAAAGRGGGQGLSRLRQPRGPQAGAAEVPDRRLGSGSVPGQGRGVPTAARCAAPRHDDVWGFDDHIGWNEQGDGSCFYGLNVENGRILDREGFTLKSALARDLPQVPARHPADGPPEHPVHRPRGRRTARAWRRSCAANGVKLDDEISTVRRWSMACVALPTCPLAVTESERVLPGVIDQLGGRAGAAGAGRREVHRPHDRLPQRLRPALQRRHRPGGQDAGKYTIYLGGRLLGDRLDWVYKELVPLDEIVPTLVPVLACFKQEQQGRETLGDFCHRKGRDALLAWAEAFAAKA